MEKGVVNPAYGDDVNWGQRAYCVTLYYPKIVTVIFKLLSAVTFLFPLKKGSIITLPLGVGRFMSALTKA